VEGAHSCPATQHDDRESGNSCLLQDHVALADAPGSRTVHYVDWIFLGFCGEAADLRILAPHDELIELLKPLQVGLYNKRARWLKYIICPHGSIVSTELWTAPVYVWLLSCPMIALRPPRCADTSLPVAWAHTRLIRCASLCE